MQLTPKLRARAFHPTLSLPSFFRYLFRSWSPPKHIPALATLFPTHETVLVDSGRSAFAVTIEALNLSQKTIALPAYVCDALLPVLSTYNVTPLFLDVDTKTFAPPSESYTEELLGRVDAVLLVATYGKKPDEEILERLKEHKKLVIEDYAMRNPLFQDSLDADARIYSLPKTFPVPDGGLAIIPKGTTRNLSAPHRMSFGFLKNVLKLLSGIAPLIARIRNAIRSTHPTPTWSGIREAGALTKHILTDTLKEKDGVPPDLPFSYCYPLLVTNSASNIKMHKVTAERIWNKPIVLNTEAQKRYGLHTEDFPHTQEVAERIVCAPLWHIKDVHSYEQYVQGLKEIFSQDSSQ